MIYYYGTGEWGTVTFKNAVLFKENYDAHESSKGYKLSDKKELQRKAGIKLAKKDAALKNKAARAFA